MKKTIFIIFLLFTFIGINTCGADISVMDMLRHSQEQQERAEERGRQQLKEFGEKIKTWGHSAKIKRIEKALLKLDTWDRTSLMRIMDRYNASLEEMNKAMKNVRSFDGYVR